MKWRIEGHKFNLRTNNNNELVSILIACRKEKFAIFIVKREWLDSKETLFHSVADPANPRRRLSIHSVDDKSDFSSLSKDYNNNVPLRAEGLPAGRVFKRHSSSSRGRFKSNLNPPPLTKPRCNQLEKKKATRLSALSQVLMHLTVPVCFIYSFVTWSIWQDVFYGLET